MNDSAVDVGVVGGGLSGLAAATYLAKAGKRVAVLERSPQLGGRARSSPRADEGFTLNFGPHALYAAGAGVRVLAELGVAFRGAIPPSSGLLGIAGGKLHALPGGLLSMLATDLLDFGAKVEAARILASLSRIDTDRLASTTVAEWLAHESRRRDVRDLLAALVRVATYSNAPSIDSAGAALAQVRRALTASVYYLDGGWQSLVDGLAVTARAAGVRLATSARVRGLARDSSGRIRGIVLSGGETLAARAVILATSPGTLMELTGETGVELPIRAACLDLALSSLPFPKRRFALGIDAPYYCSVHSATARLAPAAAAVVHVAKYLDPRGASPGDEAELEAVMDLVQPGWRERIVLRRWLPSMVVANARVTAASGARRRSPVTSTPGLFLAGDWVDGEGMLADTALSSARDAATHALSALQPSDAIGRLAAQ
jgi:phytoene dehydrogenase-like protein